MSYTIMECDSSFSGGNLQLKGNIFDLTVFGNFGYHYLMIF